MSKFWHILFVCFLGLGLVFGGPLNAQNTTSDAKLISKQKIEETKKKKEFDYYESYTQKEKKENSSPPKQSVNYGGFWSGLGEILPYIFIGIFLFVLAYILYNLFSESGFDRRKKYVEEDKKEEITTVEEIDEEYIEENDFDQLILRAKKNLDYRLALRLMFLKALQLLNNKELIRYKKNKTNFDYSFEIKETTLKAQFLQTSDVFAWVWYGRESLDFETYQQLEKDFTTLIQKVEA